MNKIILTVLMIFIPIITYAATLEVSVVGNNVGLGTTTASEQLTVGSMGQFTVDSSGNVVTSGTIQTTGILTGKTNYIASNLGIGTINPMQALDVQGTIRASVAFIAGTGSATITGSSGGNIGIGSATPGSQLDVIGTVRATNFSGAGTGLTGTAASLTAGVVSTISGLVSQGTNVTITGSGTSGSPYVIASSGGGGSSLFTTINTNDVYENNSGTFGNIGIGTSLTTGGRLIVTGGNVGIGSTAPGTALDVLGTVRVTGVTAGAGNFTFSGDTSTGLTNTSFKLHDNAGIATIRNNGSSSGTGLQIDGSFDGGLGASNGSLILASEVGNSSANGDNIQFQLNNGTTAMEILHSTGGFYNVGVGSANPGATLDVLGTVKLTSGTAGAVLCLTTSNTIGHCTAAASCLTTCTCTCTVN